jgi:hypothetical protein
MDLSMILSMNLLALNASSVVSFLTPCYPYTISKVEGGKYPKQVSKGDFLVEVWIALL